MARSRMARTRPRKRPASGAPCPLAEVVDAFLREHVEAKRKASTAAWMRDALKRIVKPRARLHEAGRVTRPDVARLHSSTNDGRYKRIGRSQSSAHFIRGPGRADMPPKGIIPRAVSRNSRRAARTIPDARRTGAAWRALRQEGETAGLPYAVDETKPGARARCRTQQPPYELDPFAAPQSDC